MAFEGKKPTRMSVEMSVRMSDPAEEAKAITTGDAVEAMTPAQVNARCILSERIRKWKELTFENVCDDIIKNTTFSFTTAAELEKKAYALLDEYNAVVAAHEKLFARRYRITHTNGVTRVTSYLYKYPTKELWMERPSNDILIQLFTAAAEAAGDEKKADEMKEIASGYISAQAFNEYRGIDTLPSTAELCPDPLVSEEEKDTKDTERCAIQGGSKKSKSKSKYSRKSKSKYSRKY